MKTKEKNLSPKDFIEWAISERKKRGRGGQARIDARVAVLHKQGTLDETLFNDYQQKINM